MESGRQKKLIKNTEQANMQRNRILEKKKGKKRGGGGSRIRNFADRSDDIHHKKVERNDPIRSEDECGSFRLHWHSIAFEWIQYGVRIIRINYPALLAIWRNRKPEQEWDDDAAYKWIGCEHIAIESI